MTAGAAPAASVLREDARIALLSPCGFGNLGDAAIVSSAVDAIRRRLPRASVFGLTLNPEDTVRRHGIPAYTCTGFSLSHYGAREPSAAAAPSTTVQNAPPAPNGMRARLRRAALALPPARKALRLASIARADLRHQRASRPHLDRLDLLVVAGGGQLDEFWGGPLGHPYSLWRWSRQARRVGARVVVLSVGTGVLDTALGRYFVRGTLAGAAYVSLRDAGSRQMLGASSPAAAAPIVPDLAYAVPVPPAAARPRQPAGAASGRAVVALSPLSYCDPRIWPDADEHRYQRHVRTMAELARRLAGDGHQVVLFATDGSDQRTVEEVHALAQTAQGQTATAEIEARVVSDVPELLQLYASSDAVVAARLHGVLLAHVAGTPTLALSYERKVRTLMREMSQDDLCLEIDDFDPQVGHDRVRALLARRAEVAADIRSRVQELRAAVEQQYDKLLGAARSS
jgi:polysaccharide pyruvyl transferase WcaK-like protein